MNYVFHTFDTFPPGLQDGGFEPPKAESTTAKIMMKGSGLVYPEPPVMILLDGTNAGLNVSSAEFMSHYEEIAGRLLEKAPVRALVSVFNYPEMSHLVSTDNMKALVYAQISGDIETYDFHEVVDGTPLDVKVGGDAIFGNDMGKMILKGVEYAEFGSIPILFVLLLFSLGSVYSGLLPWYVAFGGIFWTLAFLCATNDGFRISSVAANITTMFGLGLAIDYALFIVSRFKKERTMYPDAPLELIVSRTVQTSGRTVAFSAITVFVALSGGLLFEEFFICSLCYAVMVAAVCSAVGANTYLIAQMAILDKSINKFPVSLSCCTCGMFGLVSDTVKPSAYTAVDTPSASTNAQQTGEEAKQYDSLEPSSTSKDTRASLNADEIDPETNNSVWLIVGRFVLKYPAIIFFLSTSLLVAFTAVFFTHVKYGVVDAVTANHLMISTCH